MTRFARATGSKAANSRAPEAATPWPELRAQLHQAQQAQHHAQAQAHFESKRKENYENFLKEHKESSVQKVWCEFENQPSSKNENEPSNDVPVKKNKRKKDLKRSLKAADAGETINTAEKVKKIEKSHEIPECSDEEMDADNEELTKWLEEFSDGENKDEYEDLTTQLENILKKNEESIKSDKAAKKKNKKKMISETKLAEANDSTPTQLDDPVEKLSDKKSKKKNKSANVETREENIIVADVIDDSKKKNKKKKTDENIVGNIITSDNITDQVKKEKKKKKTTPVDNIDVVSESNLENNVNTSEEIEEKPENENKKKKNKKRKAENSDKNDAADESSAINSPKKRKTESDSQTNAVQPKNKKKDNPKRDPSQSNGNRKDKPGEYARRKPLNEEKTILIVNGEEVEVTNYGGFPILSKDAERLQQLRKNLISKGIPRSEINRTMKLERRRAEKSLSRIKKKLCFHCRKGGHNLSECPELNKKSDSTGLPSSGICFKCGSTEHTHFACRVVKTQHFKFASCFICNQQGHISKQCPDNPRGLYPKGGGCRECGDVTHLKKDCPKILQLREDNTMKLDTIESGNIEDISKKQTIAKDTTSKVKHVKF